MQHSIKPAVRTMKWLGFLIIFCHCIQTGTAECIAPLDVLCSNCTNTQCNDDGCTCIQDENGSGSIPCLNDDTCLEPGSHCCAAELMFNSVTKCCYAMETLDRFKDSGFHQPSRLGGQQISSYTDWQTPQISGKPVSRIALPHGIKRGGDILKDASCTENVEDYCNASGSTPFQPIKSQITIPTAHVVPSTLVTSSINGCMQDRVPLSTEAVFDPSTADDTRKFEMPAIEPTLNQSDLLNTFCYDPRQEVPAAAAKTAIGQYKALPESRETKELSHFIRPGVSGVVQQRWGLESYNVHPGSEYSAWRPQPNPYTDNPRLKMEKLQLMRDYSAIPAHPAVAHQAHNDWERIIKTSDNLLLEKEMMLERQRQHISQLEQRLIGSEVQAHGNFLNQASAYQDLYQIRLQDLQREVTFLRAQFAEKNESSCREKADLERKLCAMEGENRNLKEAMKGTAQKHSEEMKKQEERVKGREKHINSLKKKCQKEAEQNKEKQQKIETLQRYLADLPTVQDHQKQLQELKELKEKNCLLQEQTFDLERKLTEARAAWREMETKLASQKLKEQEYRSLTESLQNELKKLETTDWKVEEKRLLQEAEDLRKAVETVQKEKESLRKVVESQKKKMEQMSSKVKELEEQVSHEEGTGQALKEESHQKETALQQLKIAVKELAIQNQDLMERNVTLQEKLRLACTKGQPTELEATKLFKLYKEMNRCHRDLKSVCILLSQGVQGSDPNLSMLLGVHSMSITEDQDEQLDSLSLEKYQSGIDQLKRDIEDLRSTISDRYAQDMGDNCITQ
ncbi:centrosomal protein of 85 kDa [Gastrophryne carolinensis]